MISERNVVEVAVMRLIRFRIDILAEMLAGDAHARNRDFSLQLERANQFYEHGKKSNLLLHRQILGRRRQNLRPSVFDVTCLCPKRGEMDGHDAIVDFPPASANQTLMLKRSDDFRSGGQLNGEFSGNRRDGRRLIRSRPEKRQHLNLQGTNTLSSLPSPCAALHRQTDF